MTRDDVIRMATDANILEPLGYECPHRKSWRDDVVRGLERFAALVAANEREMCAKLCEEQESRILSKQKNVDPHCPIDLNIRLVALMFPELAGKIRARR